MFLFPTLPSRFYTSSSAFWAAVGVPMVTRPVPALATRLMGAEGGQGMGQGPSTQQMLRMYTSYYLFFLSPLGLEPRDLNKLDNRSSHFPTP